MSDFSGGESGAAEPSNERDAYTRIRPPNSTALSAGALDDHVKIRRQTVGRRNLKASARGRKIPDGTFKLRRLVAKNDLGGLQHALAKDGSFFRHGWMPRIAMA